MAVRSLRLKQEIAQEALANISGIDRSHIGKIERGEHMPTLAIILRIAKALNCSASILVAETERNLVQVGNTAS
ncbi:helix-turn-helix domain-containing protein [Pectobacterium actinidiae]